ncbi:armadillo-like helical domain-containing protein 3 [Uranotaenia lowii]|uniref:armadillo-like helical domain-containing protein 3 n=1 Tax=Uranotaenia lowii TaxID=190385 RepID=UPI00247B2396|nr:armadillo-like helical domain-containing protein 3 [Uranotaenia lowii]XP_055588594.1 armadillo-like helical domain-containing protein 3 [Uranotaenia lowii]XP_055588595.1 armadillo-like helical domain-containing protein 3 [Uranotaenia lowii]
MSSRKRSGSGSKRPKEKVVYIYELLMRGEETGKDNQNFWDEFFLLQPNTEVLEQELLKLDSVKLGNAKNNILSLFNHCVEVLHADNNKRIHNALITLSVLVFALFKRHTATGEEGQFNIFSGNNISGIENVIKQLVERIKDLLVNEEDDCSRFYCIKLLFTVVTGMDNLSQNLLLEYIMVNNLFDSLKKLLSDPTLRQEHGQDIVILLTLLVNYRKDEGTNPYVVHLSLLDDELALHGFGQIISATLFEFIRQQTVNLISIQNNSWISSLSSMVGNIFLSDEVDEKMQHIRQNNALLLAFYEAVHLNRNFITTLATTQAESSSPPSPSNTLNNHHSVGDLATAPLMEVTQYPTNLFVAVFQYCSVVMMDHKNESSVTNLKLCFIILTCISEDQYANSMMHDSNLTFKVFLHRAQMRHRKIAADRITKPQPLAATLMDLLVEFIVSHLMKKFPLELYLLCIGIIHRIIVYQKRCRIRLLYPWKELWTSLISLLKFIVYQEQNLIKKCNIFNLAIQVVNIFNLFITYGDTFLATTSSYDELYYELNREEKVFSEIHAMVLRYTSMEECEYKEDVFKLLNSLVNILAIIKHFQIKIKEWLSAESLSTPTEEQILNQIQKNYDLTLKLQDSLDFFERYSEKPHDAFFKNLVKEVVIDMRKSVHNVVKSFNDNRPKINS